MLKRILKIFSYFVLSIAVILCLSYVYLAMSEGKAAEKYRIFTETKTHPLVIAHRGGAGISPENTLFAYRRAIDLGVDMLELDIHRTIDGELVVIHDSKVDRTTDGSGAIAAMTLEEIKKLDAGFRWTNDGGKTFPFRGQNIQIPTLREVFEAFPGTKINVEPKYETPSPVAPLCNLIKEFNREDKVIIGSFRDEVLEDFRKTCSNVATSASPSEATFFMARYKIGLSQNSSPQMQVLQIPQRIGSLQIVDENYIKAIHERHLDVHVWTINDVEDMKRLIEIKADGIMTDYPDRLLELLRSER